MKMKKWQKIALVVYAVVAVALIAVAAAAVYGVSCLISIGICKRKNG